MRLPAHRYVARGLLATFAAWQLLCFSDNVQLLREEPRRFPDWTWPATWQMFTKKGGMQQSMHVEGRFENVWVKLPMAEWLPTEWEAEYRWERAAGSARTLRPFLLHACERADAAEVRLVRSRWALVPGRYTQPERDAKVDVMGSVRCP